MAKNVKWEMKMNEQRDLRRQGITLLFQRVKLLIEVYNDAAFRGWCEQNKVVELDYLDAELSDVAACFLTLKSVMESYPNESDWQSKNIRELMAEAIESQKTDRQGAERISWKERCLAAEKECERLRAENATLRSLLEKPNCAAA